MTQNQPQQSPISGHVDAANYHPSPAHEEALARLHYLVEQHLRVGILLGEAGSGKSMLLAKLAAEAVSPNRRVLRLSLLGLEAEEMLTALATQLQLNPQPATTPPALWRSISDRLKEFQFQQHSTVILLDDVHEATSDTLAAICRLVEMNATEQARVTIIAAAQSSSVAKLPRRLLDRASLRVDVEPWEMQDTLEFLTHAVEQLRAIDGAEEVADEVFTEDAVAKLHELSGGIPRRVSQLASWALLAGAGLGLESVDDETVETAAEELGVRAVV